MGGGGLAWRKECGEWLLREVDEPEGIEREGSGGINPKRGESLRIGSSNLFSKGFKLIFELDLVLTT
jgi:hypothetical protein